MSHPTQPETERVLLVGLSHSGRRSEEEESLEELARLVETAGAEEVGRVMQYRDHPDPATYLGKGKAKEVMDMAHSLDADAVIFDDELAPAQGRNLEDLAGVNPLDPRALKIIDRTGLILDVFAQHAHSAEGKLQVELAQIEYNVPRLRGWGEVMSRLGGGIGTRGPGETKLEVDRRRINRRLSKLKKEMAAVERTRKLKRGRREETGIPQIGLVGYTNAGKSTLLNALTEAGALVEDQLFSTLDPIARRLELPDGTAVVLVDTVGFVKKLPHQLIEAFKSTLEETALSDLLIHVVDATAPDFKGQIAAVDDVLRQIGASEIPTLLAFNKADQLSEAERAEADGLLVSARDGEGLDTLLGAVLEKLSAGWAEATFFVPFDRGDVRAWLYEHGEVLAETSHSDGVELSARVKLGSLGKVTEFIVAQDDVAAASGT